MASETLPERFFVTGANGFIGANLVRALLAEGAEVHALVRPDGRADRLEAIAAQLRLHEADLASRDDFARLLESAGPDVIVHLAAHGGHPRDATERARLLRDAVTATENLFEGAAALGDVRVVHVGSSLEYGRKRRPHRESDRLEPSTFRGAAKAASTMLALAFAAETEMPVTVVRPFSVYGPWEGRSRFVPTAVLAAIEGRELPLDPGARHDWVFVADLVDAILRAAATDLPTGEIVNVGSGRQVTNEELVACLECATGTAVRIRLGTYASRPWDTDSWVADVSKAERLLGWRPAHTLEQGLAKTYAWFRSQRDDTA